MGLEIKILFYPLSVHILQSNNSQLQLQKSMDIISSHSFMYWYNGKKNTIIDCESKEKIFFH